jgi:hypothetical protein
MILIAVVTPLAWAPGEIKRRRERFEELAGEHKEQILFRWECLDVLEKATFRVDDEESWLRYFAWERQITRWHRQLYNKYEHAARYPWLPVWPDPPKPEWAPGNQFRTPTHQRSEKGLQERAGDQ